MFKVQIPGKGRDYAQTRSLRKLGNVLER
jgi:hypothetical protein